MISRLAIKFIFALLIFTPVYGFTAPFCKSLFETISTEQPAIQNFEMVLQSIQNSTRRLTTRDLGIDREVMKKEIRRDPRFDWISEIILDNHALFATNRNEERRLDILREGFLNQYEADKSGGKLDPKLRLHVEAAHSGLTPNQYEKVNVGDRPKYGYVIPPLNSALQRDSQLMHYGKDIFVFKKDRLEHRTTWFAGDSLDERNSRSRNTINNKFEGSELEGEVILPSLRSKRFFSWSDRDLLLPHLKADLDEPPSTLEFQDSNYEKIDLPNGKKINRIEMPEQTYIELQFWEKLGIDDVDAFIFSGTPPSGAFLKALQKRKIPIYFQQKKIKNKPAKTVLWWAPPDFTDIHFNMTPKFRNWILPSGQLKFLRRGQGSTGGRWFVDEAGEKWFLKKDVVHEGLQTGAEAISSRIYRHFGYRVAETHVYELDNERVSVSKSLGNKLNLNHDLKNQNGTHFRMMRAVAAFLKDWDRLQYGPNNIDYGDGEYALFDFGGTLGSRAQGEFKPGEILSKTIGGFAPSENIKSLWKDFDVKKIGKDHPWQKFNYRDAQDTVTAFKTLTDEIIKEIVESAKYLDTADTDLMIKILINRRNLVINNLFDLYPNPN